MTNDPNNPEQIEREIEQDREALRRTLDDLQDELSLDGMARRVTDKFREHGSEWANSASNAARANPVALAVTGVGLAWMIFGRGYDPTHRAPEYFSHRKSHDERPRMPAGDSFGRAPGYPASGEPRTASMQGYGNDRGFDSNPRGKTDDEESSMTDKIRNKTAHLRDRVSQGSHNLRHRVGDSAWSMRDRIGEGTENMSEDARRRVQAARRKALDASDAASRHFNDAGRTVSRGYDTEPLLFGAAAFALGAGLAALLPRTQREDELMGRYSDQLFDEAESIYEEEKGRLQSAVSAGMNEAKSAASDVTKAAEKELTKDRPDTSTGTAGSTAGTAGTAGSTPGNAPPKAPGKTGSGI